MKKLVTLILVLAGMVSTVSAADITRRIYIEIQGDLATSWSWKNQAPVVWIGSSSNKVETTLKKDTYDRDNKKNKLYYADIAGEDLSELDLIITSGEDTDDQWHSVHVDDVDLSETNKIFYIYIYNNACNAFAADFNYKFTYWEDGGSHKYIDLTYDGNDMKGQYENSGTNYAVLFPSFVTDGGPFSSWLWEFAIRPKNDGDDYLVNNFMVYNDKLTGADKSFKFTEPMTYNLSFNIYGDFKISPYFTRNISAGYATFSSAYDVAVAGATAYYCTGVAGGELSMSEFSDGIPAGQGALLEGPGEVTFTPAASALVAPGTNWLKPGTGEPVPQTDGAGNTNFILTNKTVSGSADLKFYKVNSAGNTVATGKAYLQIPSAYVGAHEYFWFEDETTGIEAAKASQKMNGEFFNLAGQRVAQPAKGLYIVNGKKVIMK